MKKLIVVFALMATFLATTAYSAKLWNGQRTGQLTTSATTSGVAVTGPGILHGLFLITDGTNKVFVNIYDSATASTAGTKLVPADLAILGAARSFALSYSPPVYFANGLFITVSSAGTLAFQIEYDQ